MSQNRKFRLKQDSIGSSGIIPKGTIIEIQNESYEWCYTSEPNNHPFKKSFVESTPSIFELITEKERIEVYAFMKSNADSFPFYHFTCTKEIPPGKYESVKQAIESILNDTP